VFRGARCRSHSCGDRQLARGIGWRANRLPARETELSGSSVRTLDDDLAGDARAPSPRAPTSNSMSAGLRYWSVSTTSDADCRDPPITGDQRAQTRSRVRPPRPITLPRSSGMYVDLDSAPPARLVTRVHPGHRRGYRRSRGPNALTASTTTVLIASVSFSVDGSVDSDCSPPLGRRRRRLGRRGRLSNGILFGGPRRRRSLVGHFFFRGGLGRLPWPATSSSVSRPRWWGRRRPGGQRGG